MVRFAAQAALMAIALGTSATSAFAHDANRDVILPLLLRQIVDPVLDADSQKRPLRGPATGDKLMTMFVNSLSDAKNSKFRKQVWDDRAPNWWPDDALPNKGPNF